MIKIKDVEKSYNTETKIGPLDIEIERGGINSIIGPNGAGKSTTLLMVGRLLNMDCGTINVGGMDIKTCSSKKLATILSVLRQENNFTTKLTVSQLIGFGRYPHGVVQAIPDAYHAAKKNDIKVIYGVEGYLVEDEPKIAWDEQPLNLNDEIGRASCRERV